MNGRIRIELLEQRLHLAYGDLLIMGASTNHDQAVDFAGDGNAIVAMRPSMGWGALAISRYDRAGGGEYLYDIRDGLIWLPDVGAGPDGRFVVTFTEDLQIYALRFGADGKPLGPRVRVSPRNGFDAATEMASDGSFTVVYAARNDATGGWDLCTRKYDSSGVALGGETVLAAYANTGDPPKHSLAMADDGTAYVSWYRDQQINLQVIGPAGQKLGEVRVLGSGVYPSVAVDASGAGAVAWTGFPKGAYLQRFDRTGALVGGPLLVSASADAIPTSIGSTPDGILTLTWSLDSGIYVRRYDSGNQSLGTRRVGQGGNGAILAVNEDGGCMVTWHGVSDGYERLLGRAFGPGTLEAVLEPVSLREGDRRAIDPNVDFPLNVNVTAYEWDLDYDGQSFDVDATVRAPVMSAAGTDGPSGRQIGLRVRADDGSVSPVATTVVTVENMAPTGDLVSTSDVQPGNVGEVRFDGVTDPSPADRDAGFLYSYDFDNDGTYDVVDSPASKASVPASYLAAAGTHTVRGRLADRDGGWSEDTAAISVVAMAPSARFGAGGAVALGSSAVVSFTSIQDSPADLEAGFTYSYDLNGDGIYETSGRVSEAEIPVEYLSTVGIHLVHGRLIDRSGSFNEFLTEVRVTAPDEYFPTLAGLTWQFTTREGDRTSNFTSITKREQFNGEDCLVIETTLEGSTSVSRRYLFVDGQTYYQRYTYRWSPEGTTDYWPDRPVVAYVFDQPAGWSETTNHISDVGHIQPANSYMPPAIPSSDFSSKVSVLGTQPLSLSNGLYFAEALGIETKEEGTWTTQYPDGSWQREEARKTRISWFVRGLGMVSEQYHSEAKWTNSKEQTKYETTDRIGEMPAIPDWAKYTTLAAGILQINGTVSEDSIRFGASGTNLVIYRNGLPEMVPFEGLTGIVINGRAGNDTIDVSMLSFAATINGSAGNDTILGGSGADLIYGGGGDDQISASDGADTIYGNFGSDVIAGGLQRDSILGGLGDDTVTAGDGPDSVYGGDGMDELRGGKGADYVEGKGKADVIYGGIGNDTIYGNAGDDLVYAEDGDDSVYVNDGANSVFRDTVYAGAGADVIDRDGLDSVFDDEVQLLG